MRLERMEIQNFASYYGEHSLDFTCSVECPVVVVLGGTGYGKTSLFDALNWSIYGREYERQLEQRRHRDILDYVNEIALKEAHATDTAGEMSCTMYFDHEGNHYYINQSILFTAFSAQSGQLNARMNSHSTSLYEITPNGNHRQIDVDISTSFLDEILPSNVRDYFLFDGDRIHQLSSPGASQEVRDAIYRVVDLELIKNAITHLSEIAIEYGRDIARQSKGEQKQIEERLVDATENLRKLKDQRDNLSREEQAAKAQIDVLESQLENLPDTSKYQEQRSKYVSALTQLDEEYQKNIINLRKACVPASYALVRDSIRSLLAELDAKRVKGQIPRTVSQMLLRDLLRTNVCLCGTQFSEGDPIYQRLMDRLSLERRRPSEDALLELLVRLRDANSSLDSFGDSLLSLDEQNHEMREQRRELDLAIKDVDAELGKLPQADVAATTGALRARRNDLVTLTRKIQKSTDDIDLWTQKASDYKKQSDQLAKHEKQLARIKLRQLKAQKGADTLEALYAAFAEESRIEVEKLTREEFKKFVVSSSDYDVALTGDYELRVLDSNGNPALQRLSMGQTQCLSLAFITAISRVSEKNPPIAIDMPFGRLDPDVHDRVSRRMPELTSQLILFLIPGVEWNEKTAKNLEPRASHIYQLRFDERERRTTIESVR